MKLLPGFNDMFDDFFDDSFFAPAGRVDSMRCDIKETDNGYEMNMELPGYKKEDIKIDLNKGYLNVSAASNTDKEDKDKEGHVIRRERYSGSCSRSFYVGEGLKEEDIKARFDNGELVIAIPKNAPQEIEEKKFISIE